MAEKNTSVAIQDINFPSKVCSPWTWRLANGFMAVFFALSAYVQVCLIWYLTSTDAAFYSLFFGVLHSGLSTVNSIDFVVFFLDTIYSNLLTLTLFECIFSVMFCHWIGDHVLKVLEALFPPDPPTPFVSFPSYAPIQYMEGYFWNVTAETDARQILDKRKMHWYRS